MKIAIVGAGPRGLAVAERLISNAARDAVLDVTIIDPYHLGGRVWDPFIPNNQVFLQNTVTEQVTLFSDESLENGGVPVLGPNLYQWIRDEAPAFLAAHPEIPAFYQDLVARLGSNDFAPRGLMGVYATWFFEWLQSRLSGRQQLTFVQEAALDLTRDGDGYVVHLADETTIWAEQVVLGLGHGDNVLSAHEAALADFAHEHDLSYLPPMHPSEAPLDDVAAGETVLIEGLGLSFFDYMYGLTAQRGGEFVRVDGQLEYRASGQEPRIVAGSRSGFPLHARGVNQKAVSELYQAQFLTLPALEALRELDGGHLTYASFEKLLVKEMTYKHLLNVLDTGISGLPFEQAEKLRVDLLTSGDLVATAVAAGIDPAVAAFDLSALMHPERDFDGGDYQVFMLAYLQRDIDDAKQGNKLAPYAGAFDILRDVRDRIRTLVEKAFFTVDEYQVFLTKFTPINSLLSVGPPVDRIEQLAALMRAGIVTLAAPGFGVQGRGDAFVAQDSLGQTWTAATLLAARLGKPDLAHTRNPLLVHLRERGWATTPVLRKKTGEDWRLSAVKIDRQTFELIDANNHIVPNVYLYGVPVEGWKWFTTVIPRPGVNTVILREGAWIAQTILQRS
ncbi:MAG TPA: FAD/NAD(P)-binding protein [Lactobacillaceae bacterium]